MGVYMYTHMHTHFKLCFNQKKSDFAKLIFLLTFFQIRHVLQICSLCLPHYTNQDNRPGQLYVNQ